MSDTASVAAPIGALLSRAIDYAGLFPPASLDLTTAVANYQAYRDGPDAWALGRLVAKASDLPSLATMSGTGMPLSVLLGPAIDQDLERLLRFDDGTPGPGRVEAVELKGPLTHLDKAPSRWPRYLELPLDEHLETTLDEIANRGALAKVRTGGTIAEAIPKARELARFLVACAGRRLPFKATAGLHHPVRGSYRLTYEAGAPRGVLFGYLNLAVAAVIAWTGGEARETEAALVETGPGAIHWDGEALHWRAHRFPAEAIAALRRESFHGFGSCSFREPLDELAGLGSAQ